VQFFHDHERMSQQMSKMDRWMWALEPVRMLVIQNCNVRKSVSML